MPELQLPDLLRSLPVGGALVAAAVCAGFSKTAIGNLSTISVALAAAVMPARSSTALVLVLLMVGDICAVIRYRGSADLPLLRQVIPGVLPGLAVGAVLLMALPDDVLRRGIGGVLLALVVLQLVQRTQKPDLRRRGALIAGVSAGATTMVANAAGPVMSLYLLARGVDKLRFLGTSAWFFAGINVCKVPIVVALGLLDPFILWTAVVLVPAVLAGAVAGIVVVRHLNQVVFERAVVLACAVSATALILG